MRVLYKEDYVEGRYSVYGVNERALDKNVELPENAMLRRRPELFYEWDFERNDELDLDAYKMTRGQDVLAWWICPDCKSSYDMTIYVRVGRNRNCPYCSGHRVNHTNSLASLRSDLLAEWNYIKNKEKSPNNLTTGTSKKVWWTCLKCNSDYDMRVNHKVDGIGCPYCRGMRVNHTNSLASLRPDVASEWHLMKNENLSPHEVTLHSNKKAW